MSPEKKSKLEQNSATILQSTPKRRGRPRGMKNGMGKKNTGSKNKTSSRKQGKAKGKKSDNVANVVDDKENIPSEELIANFRIHGRSRGETGCTSPVKKNLKEK